MQHSAGRLIASDKPYKVSKLRSAAAICWTFVVSGLMHEFLIWYALKVLRGRECLLQYHAVYLNCVFLVHLDKRNICRGVDLM